MPAASENTANAKPQMTPNVCRSLAELRPNSHMLPSRTFGRTFGRTSASAELRPISSVQATSWQLIGRGEGVPEVAMHKLGNCLMASVSW